MNVIWIKCVTACHVTEMKTEQQHILESSAVSYCISWYPSDTK